MRIIYDAYYVILGNCCRTGVVTITNTANSPNWVQTYRGTYSLRTNSKNEPYYQRGNAKKYLYKRGIFWMVIKIFHNGTLIYATLYCMDYDIQNTYCNA